jgi:hypothetical protein
VLLRNKILSLKRRFGTLSYPLGVLPTFLRFEFADDPDETEDDVEIQVP